jgi:hypothetical protein
VANYVSTIGRAGLQAALRAELMEFRLVNPAGAVVTDAKKGHRNPPVRA